MMGARSRSAQLVAAAQVGVDLEKTTQQLGACTDGPPGARSKSSPVNGGQGLAHDLGGRRHWSRPGRADRSPPRGCVGRPASREVFLRAVDSGPGRRVGPRSRRPRPVGGGGGSPGKREVLEVTKAFVVKSDAERRRGDDDLVRRLERARPRPETIAAGDAGVLERLDRTREHSRSLASADPGRGGSGRNLVAPDRAEVPRAAPWFPSARSRVLS